MTEMMTMARKRQQKKDNQLMARWLVRGVATLLLLIACAFDNDIVTRVFAKEEAEESATEGAHNHVVIDIGTGSKTGVYYPAGVGICSLLGTGTATHTIRCRALNTGGSTYNLENVQNGTLQLGIAQADTLYRAWGGQAPFKEKGVKLRVLFALHEEMVTLAVHRNAEIVSFKRLQGKRLNLGPEGSGNERVVSEMFKACHIFPGDLGVMGRLKPADVPEAMLSGLMDGYFYVVGHPNNSLVQAAKSMPLDVIPLSGRCINTLVKNHPFFDITVIPGGLYRGVDQDVATFGVKAWVVSSIDTSADTIYHVVETVFENMDAFRKQKPTFYRLSPRRMIKRVDIPYHEGALKYYQKKGWYEE